MDFGALAVGFSALGLSLGALVVGFGGGMRLTELCGLLYVLGGAALPDQLPRSGIARGDVVQARQLFGFSETHARQEILSILLVLGPLLKRILKTLAALQEGARALDCFRQIAPVAQQALVNDIHDPHLHLATDFGAGAQQARIGQLADQLEQLRGWGKLVQGPALAHIAAGIIISDTSTRSSSSASSACCCSGERASRLPWGSAVN